MGKILYRNISVVCLFHHQVVFTMRGMRVCTSRFLMFVPDMEQRLVSYGGFAVSCARDVLHGDDLAKLPKSVMACASSHSGIKVRNAPWFDTTNCSLCISTIFPLLDMCAVMPCVFRYKDRSLWLNKCGVASKPPPLTSRHRQGATINERHHGVLETSTSHDPIVLVSSAFGGTGPC